MSSIIKSGRIRSRSVLDFSDRVHVSLAESQQDLTLEEVAITNEYPISEMISQKEEELANLELLIQEKLADADNKIEEMLAEAVNKAEQIKKEAKAQETALLADAYRQQEKILGDAKAEVEQVKQLALKEKRKMLEAVEGEVVETMITLLQHIISEEVTQNVQWLKCIVRKMLLKEEVNEPTTLLISKKNMEGLKEEKEQFIANLSKLTAIEVSDNVDDTTCVLVTKQGNIEYDVNEGLARVVKELRVLKGLSQEQV